MANGRCRFHGGKSTGAKTVKGLLRQKMASWKHGQQSKETIEEARKVRALLNDVMSVLNGAG
jgi:hypothetical protein